MIYSFTGNNFDSTSKRLRNRLSNVLLNRINKLFVPLRSIIWFLVVIESKLLDLRLIIWLLFSLFSRNMVINNQIKYLLYFTKGNKMKID